MKRLSERVWLGGLAAAGVILAHSLSYLLVTPDPHARERLLSATGHRYFTLICALAVGILVAAVAGGVIQRLGESANGRTATAGTCVQSALILSVLQVAGFILLEATERALVGDSPLHLLGEPVMAIGILVQIVVALGAAVVLVGLAGGVDRIAARIAARSAPPSNRAIAWWVTSVLPPTPSPVAARRTLRGPPVFSN